MGFQEVVSLDCDNAIQLGGKDRKTNKAHPTRLEGYYVGSKQVPSPKSKTGFSKLHIFQTEKGNTGVWGKTDLDRKLANTTIGAMTRVTYTGMKETKNNPMYVYKVEVDLENVIEINTASETEEREDLGNNGEASANYDDAEDDTDPGEEAAQPDEITPARAAAPRQAAQAPSAAAQKKVQDLLAGRRKTA